jgi:hypothetical protein
MNIKMNKSKTNQLKKVICLLFFPGNHAANLNRQLFTIFFYLYSLFFVKKNHLKKNNPPSPVVHSC